MPVSTFNPQYGTSSNLSQRQNYSNKEGIPNLPSAFIITHLQIGNNELNLLKNIAKLLGKTNQNTVSVYDILKECLERLDTLETENTKRKKNSGLLSQKLQRMNSINNMDNINYVAVEDELVNSWLLTPQHVEQKKDYKYMQNLVSNKNVDNKREQSIQLFRGIIQPLPEKQYFSLTQDQQILHIKRGENVFKDIISTQDLFKYINNYMLEYTYNIDVVKFVNGEKHVCNTNKKIVQDTRNYREDGQIVEQTIVEERYKDGYTIRFLHPQRYFDKLWYILGSLETLFHCECFCQIQITPPNSQGYPPCYDDMDGFILQLEGSKTWIIHRGVDESNILSRYPAEDLDKEKLGQKVLEVTLNPGDFLYLPRGAIYYSFTGAEPSTNFHINANKQQTWYDIMQDILSGALENLEIDHPIVRTTIPKDVWGQTGGMHQNKEGNNSVGGQIYARKLLNMFDQLVAAQLPIDPVVDNKAAAFISRRLPPFSNERTSRQKNKSQQQQLTHQDRVRIYDPTAVRVQYQDQEVVVYHSFNNSRQHHAMDLMNEDDGQNKMPNNIIRFPQRCAVFLEKLCSGGSVRLEAFQQEEQGKGEQIIWSVTDKNEDQTNHKDNEESEANVQEYIDGMQNPSLLSIAQILYDQGLLLLE